MEVPRRPPAPRPKQLLLPRPPKNQFLAFHQRHLPLGHPQPTELAVRTMAIQFAATGHRDLVAPRTVSVATPLLTVAMGAKADLAPVLPSLLPQDLRPLPQTPTEARSRLSVKLVSRPCTRGFCPTEESCFWIRSRTTLKLSFPMASSLTPRNTTLRLILWLGCPTRLVLVNWCLVLS